MEAGIPIQVLLPLTIAAMMLGVGMNLRIADFTALLRQPGAAILGLVSLFLIFPALAFPVAWLFSLPPELAVGLVLLAASPSASTSTAFTDLGKGDVALSLALTTASKILSTLTIPIYVSIASLWFTNQDTRLSLSFADTSERMALMVLLPMLIGMGMRHFFPDFTRRARSYVMRIAIGALVLLIALLVIRERHALPGMLLSSGPAAFTLCVLGMLWGYASTTLLGYTPEQRSAITLETGMQSGGTTIAIAAGLLASPAMAVPGAVYSLIMYVMAGLFVLFTLRTGKRRPSKAVSPLSGE